jgi:hypothetical protein
VQRRSAKQYLDQNWDLRTSTDSLFGAKASVVVQAYVVSRQCW